MTQLCVIFDIDGTLCDTNAVDDECYRDAAAYALGVAPSRIDWTACPHITDSGIARWLWDRTRERAPTPEEVAHLRRSFFQRLEAELLEDAQRFCAVSGAPQFLEQLQRLGVVLGIGTGGWRHTAELKLTTAGLPTHLLYATADDAESRVDIFSLAWRRATANEMGLLTTVLIGDSVGDVATARTLDWRFIGVGAGANAERLRRAGALTIVPDYANIDARDTLQRAEVPLQEGATEMRIR